MDAVFGGTGARRLLLLAGLAVGLAACSAEAVKEVSFSGAIQPTLNAKCLQCHFGGRAPFDMTRDNSHADLKKYVIPGKAEASPLYVKVKGGHATVAPMTPEQIETLRQWINQGALKN
jgi:hypothetical protein